MLVGIMDKVKGNLEKCVFGAVALASDVDKFYVAGLFFAAKSVEGNL